MPRACSYVSRAREGLAERDGAIVLLGMITSIGAMIAAWAVTLLFIRHVPDLIDWAMHLFGN